MAPALNERPLRWWGIGALIVALGLLIASAAAVNVSLGNLSHSRAEVSRTIAILQDMNELQAALRAAESGHRRYLQIGESIYLRQYEHGSARVPDELEQLRSKVRHPAQVARLRSVSPLITERLRELSARMSDGPQASAAATGGNATQDLSSRIESLTEEFKLFQRELLAQNVADEERRARQATWAAASSGLLSLISALIGIYFMYQQRSADELRRYSLDLERQVQERTENLSIANSELDAFAHTISHDLRAPLRAIHGYSDALVEDYGAGLPEEGRRFVGAISAAALRMEALIQDILAYARMARDEITSRSVSLDAVVDSATRHLVPTSSAGAEEVVEVERPLGAVMAHPAALQQIVDNLLSNAAKFVAPGSRPHVRIRTEPAGPNVRLWVEDNGIGIAPAHQRRIFEPFERLHGVETYPGTGIGLAIVRRAVERMGGSCGVESEAGRGSRFWIELKAVGEEMSE